MSDEFEWAMLALSLVTTVVWAILVVLAVRTRQRIGMAVVGLLAAIGMAASAVAYLQGIDLIVPDLASGTFLHFIAGVGRGALFMGGLLALVGRSLTVEP